MKKDIVINYVNDMIAYYNNMQDTTRCNKCKTLKRLVKKSNIQEYNTSVSKNGVNVGLIVETLVLNYLGLKCEDKQHEIKSLVLNTANILTNKETETIYIFIISKYFNGLYKLENAQQVNGLRIGINEIRALKNQLVKVCEINDIVKA